MFSVILKGSPHGTDAGRHLRIQSVLSAPRSRFTMYRSLRFKCSQHLQPPLTSAGVARDPESAHNTPQSSVPTAAVICKAHPLQALTLSTTQCYQHTFHQNYRVSAIDNAPARHQMLATAILYIHQLNQVTEPTSRFLASLISKQERSRAVQSNSLDTVIAAAISR
jgi:hypothetical protein